MNYIFKREGATNWTIKLNKFKTTKLTRKKYIPEDVLPISVAKGRPRFQSLLMHILNVPKLETKNICL